MVLVDRAEFRYLFHWRFCVLSTARYYVDCVKSGLGGLFTSVGEFLKLALNLFHVIALLTEYFDEFSFFPNKILILLEFLPLNGPFLLDVGENLSLHFTVSNLMHHLLENFLLVVLSICTCAIEDFFYVGKFRPPDLLVVSDFILGRPHGKPEVLVPEDFRLIECLRSVMILLY